MSKQALPNLSTHLCGSKIIYHIYSNIPAAGLVFHPKAKCTQQIFIAATCDFVFPVATHSRLSSLLETISEVLLCETFLWGCVGVIFQANSLFFYWHSKSCGPRFLSRNTAHSRFLSLVSCDQKQISNILDLKTQSPVIKIVSLTLPHRADFLDLRQKSHVPMIKICCVRLA